MRVSEKERVGLVKRKLGIKLHKLATQIHFYYESEELG